MAIKIIGVEIAKMDGIAPELWAMKEITVAAMELQGDDLGLIYKQFRRKNRHNQNQ